MRGRKLQNDAGRLLFKRAPRAANRLALIELNDLCERYGCLLSPCLLVARDGQEFCDEGHVRGELSARDARSASHALLLSLTPNGGGQA
jgi:hypothetical protein